MPTQSADDDIESASIVAMGHDDSSNVVPPSARRTDHVVESRQAHGISTGQRDDGERDITMRWSLVQAPLVVEVEGMAH